MQITALTLVNRVLRRHRMDDVSNFTSPEAVLALDLVNTAIRDLLAERDYPWNVRHDGHISIFGPFVSGTLALIQDTATATIAGSTSITSITGDFVSRVVPFGASTFSNQTLKILSAATSGGSMVLTLAAAWPGSNTGALSSANWRVDISEYLLPDSVAKVLTVRHEQTPVTVVQVDPTLMFEEWQPRPASTDGEFPYVVGVGGTAVASFNSASLTSATTPRRMRLMVWPVPDSTYVLNYSYKERVTELSATTDYLYAPDEFADDVVNRAEMYSYANAMGNDPELAALQARLYGSNAAMKYGNSRSDPQRRHVVRSLDSGSPRKSDPTSYRNITGL